MDRTSAEIVGRFVEGIDPEHVHVDLSEPAFGDPDGWRVRISIDMDAPGYANVAGAIEFIDTGIALAWVGMMRMFMALVGFPEPG